MMENSPSAIAPLLLRNLLTSIFIHADKSLVYFSRKYKLLEILRCFLISFFLFFLSLLPSFFSCLTPNCQESDNYPLKSTKEDSYSVSIGGGGTSAAGGGGTSAAGGGGDSGVSRALSQLLLIMNDIPVSSRKYEVVRSLTEKLIDENLFDGNLVLREVNCAVLSAAFTRSLSELESVAAVEQGRRNSVDGGGDVTSEFFIYNRASRLIKGVGYYGRAAWRYAKSRGEVVSRSGSSAEKLAAEMLWLGQKLAACGFAEEAVCKWASASNLGWLALSAEPRLQGSLVKVSAFLIKQAKEMGNEEQDGKTSKPLEQHHIRQIKMKLLMSWLPLLCRANNGTDAPILSMVERAELERTLEDIILTLGEEEQEWVLSLWLYHFTYCPASDWPNLRSCYTRWYNASRARLVLATA